MKRVYTKIGDIYFSRLPDGTKKYFQYIANDLSQLNSDVVRGFKKTYPNDDDPSPNDIVKDEVAFYAHCVTSLGVKMGLWDKIANISTIGDLTGIIFKGTEDYARKEGDEPVKISSNWYVWKINKAYQQIGKLSDEYKSAHVGLIINPKGILELLKGNKYPENYPD